MHFMKKRRNKPLYKKFLSLRKNIRNTDKFYKFNKQKWQTFKYSIFKYKKMKKKFFDTTGYPLSNFTNFYSKKFKYNLQNKQRLSFLFGNLKKNYLKKLVKSTLKNSEHMNIYIVLLLIEKLESRLDTVLYRTNFLYSINKAKQVILHKKVYVNNIIIPYNTYLLKKGDLITFHSSMFDQIVSNIFKSRM